MLKSIFLCLLLTVSLLLLAPPPAHAHAETLQDSAAVFEILSGVNAARIANGLTPYALNSLLTQAAQVQSDYQRDIGQVTHDGAGGTRALDRVLATGYPASRANENIYAGMGGPQQAVNWWLGSTAGHVQNILHASMREVGIGVAPSPDGVTYYTVVFSAQPNVLPVFINNDAYSTNNPDVTLALTNEEIFGSSAGGIGRASQILISNSPDFANAASQPWSQFVSWRLDTGSGDGLKTIYVRFVDAAGRTADSQDSIVLDTGGGDVVIVPTSMPTLPPQPTPVPVQQVAPTLQPTNTPTLEPTFTPAHTATPEMMSTAATPTPRGGIRITTTVTPFIPAGQPTVLGLSVRSVRVALMGTLGLGLLSLVLGSFELVVRPRRSIPAQEEEGENAAED
ncbi:MAG: CAP domain-containing protein [Anaerolineae bacterium]|nr:CAP domain-containing protein [Anaerolineae bacterium]